MILKKILNHGEKLMNAFSSTKMQRKKLVEETVNGLHDRNVTEKEIINS